MRYKLFKKVICFYASFKKKLGKIIYWTIEINNYILQNDSSKVMERCHNNIRSVKLDKRPNELLVYKRRSAQKNMRNEKHNLFSDPIPNIKHKKYS